MPMVRRSEYDRAISRKPHLLRLFEGDPCNRGPSLTLENCRISGSYNWLSLLDVNMWNEEGLNPAVRNPAIIESPWEFAFEFRQLLSQNRRTTPFIFDRPPTLALRKFFALSFP
jgi:hypothetical protein